MFTRGIRSCRYMVLRTLFSSRMLAVRGCPMCTETMSEIARLTTTADTYALTVNDVTILAG